MKKFLLFTIIGLSFSIVFFDIPDYILRPLCFIGVILAYLYLSYLYFDEIIENENNKLQRKYSEIIENKDNELLELKRKYNITKK
jgi:hypothetical protein